MHPAVTRRVYQAAYSGLSNPAYSPAHRQSAANLLKKEFPEFANIVHRAMLDAISDCIPTYVEVKLTKCKTIKDVLAL